MKKNILIIGLLTLSVLLMVGFQKAYKDLELELLETRDSLVEVHDQVGLLETSINEHEEAGKAYEQSAETTIEALEKDMKTYEGMIKTWYTSDADIRWGMLKASYGVEALVHTDNGTFPLPENGKIYLDSAYVEIDIKVIPPPVLRDEELNNFVHHLDSFAEGVSNLKGATSR